MRISQAHQWLPLLSFFTSTAIASALHQNPHDHVPTIRGQNAVNSALVLVPSLRHGKRSVGIGSLVPGNPDTRISGLPESWSGIFSDITALQPSDVVSEIFIQFFKRAARMIVKNHLPESWIQRIDGGSLIIEMWNEDPRRIVTQEFVQAALLWLLNVAQNGWTGFFVARVSDKVTKEWIRIRLVNPKMLPA